MRKYVAIGALILLAGSLPALAAEGISYNLLEGSYVLNEVDDLDLEGEGVAVGGSIEFAGPVFAFASINDIEYSDSDLSSSAFTLGTGFHLQLTRVLDLVSAVSYERMRFKNTTARATEDGFGLGVGVRARLGGSFELAGTLKYVDLGHGINDFTETGSARYYFTRNFALGLDLSANDDGLAAAFAVRYDFGSRQ